MDIFAEFTGRSRQYFQEAFADEFAKNPALQDDLARIIVEPPKDASHGDLATNAALLFAKPFQISPRDIAAKLVEKFEQDEDVETADIAGPGFINLRISTSYWQKIVSTILQVPDQFGRPEEINQRLINIEYVSANPTGPLHVGHVRGAVYGDALASLLEFSGDKVTREYYVNDAGSQINTLARSAFLRYLEALGEDIGEIPEGLYPGDYLKPIGQFLADQYGATLKSMDEKERIEVIRPEVVDQMMNLVRRDLASLNIHHDVFFSERAMHGKGGDIEETVQWLENEGLVYQGRLEPPKGKLPDDWEDREQTLFRATDFGDDVDRALAKSNGDYTYFAADIAYHKNKFDRGFLSQIDILGADHGGYVKRLKAALNAVSGGQAELDIRLCQIVRLMRGGEPVKMSKRSGNMVTLAEMVEEVGSDAIRFMMLYRKNEAPLDFDFAKVLEQSKDNPVFYVQYAHARTMSVFRNALAMMPDLDFDITQLEDAKFLHDAKLDMLTDPAEISLIKAMAQYPRVIQTAVTYYEPHRVAFYLYELASEFHSFWNKGKESPHLRFINDKNRELTEVRLALVFALKSILNSGLGLLGVSAPDEMT